MRILGERDKKSNKNTILLSVMLTIALWLSACSTPTVSNGGSENISEDLLYKLIAYSIFSFEMDAIDQNFAGKPIGEVDFKFDGPYGGTVKVTGSTSKAEDVNITTESLVYMLDNVKQISTTTDKQYICNVTFNGTLKAKGSYNESYVAMSYSSTNLTVKGNITDGSSTREIDESGSVNISVSNSKVTAEVFGHTVIW